ncbi:phage tail tape measure protein [Salinarimonas sp. NSM]|uniref:phage tail tape measure protein n=1 Tax=Salinarimonas sp. NSM TaxID=3458003 RepID=UPI0040364332
MSTIVEEIVALFGVRVEGEGDLRRFRDSLRETGQAITNVGRGLTAGVTVPLMGMAGLIANVAGDFEASMNRVGAALGASEAEFDALEAAARDMGATTQFSATEAADAIEVLAKNGRNAAQILGGELEGSLTLAAATSSDLAQAADVVTDVMLQFGKTSEDTGDVVDGIAGVLFASKLDFNDYTLALAQAGGAAGALGMSFDDFNASIAATSSLFASGSDAGTSFKTFIQRLVPQTAEAEAAMRQFGLEFYDAAGNMKSAEEIAQELQDGLGGLSDAAKNEALTTIFGSDAMRTAVGYMDAGAEGIRAIKAAMDEISAAEQAAARMEGFNGQMKAMASAFEAVQLALADTGILQAFTDVVTKISEILRAIADVNPEILKFGVMVAGAAAVIGPALIVLGAMTTALAGLTWPILAAVVAFGALTAAVVKFWPEIKEAFDNVKAIFDEGGLEAVFAAAKDRILAFWEGTDWTTLGTAIAAGIGAGMAGAGEWIAEWVSGLTAQIQAVDWTQVGASVAQAMLAGIDFIAQLFDSMSTSAGGADWAAIGAIIVAGLLAIGGAVRDFVNGFFEEMSVAFGEVDWTALGVTIGTGIFEGLKSLGGSIASWFRSLFPDPRSWFGFGGGGGGGDAEPAVDGARAAGGPVRGGGTYLVGERGPELFTPGGSGFVTPHDRSMEAIAGMARSAAVHNDYSTRVGDIHVHAPTREAGDIGRTVRAAIDDTRAFGRNAPAPATP